MYSRNTEIRNLEPTDVYQLGQILEQFNSWKKLMAIIPRNFTSSQSENAPKKYNSEHIRLIERASVKMNRTGAQILFDEWGTSGRIRPTIGNLLDLLVEVQLFRAADYVAVNMLNEAAPERPATGPAAKINISLPFETEEIEEVDAVMNAVDYPESSVLMRNANEPSDMLNYDFYTKLGADKQKVNVPVSDLMNFSTNSFNSGSIPNLSMLNRSFGEGTSNQIPIEQAINTQTSNSRNSQQTIVETEGEINESEMMTDSHNIPALSALQMQSISNSTVSTNITENSTELPNLSALQIDVNSHSLITSTNIPIATTQTADLDKVKDNNHLSPTNATTGVYDSDNNLTPDLSILDQSSLDDSSLTNVTETSEDVSFDASTRLNLSENNIPMLSILQK